MSPNPRRPTLLASVRRHVGRPAHLPALLWKNLVHPFSAAAAQARFDRRFGIDTSGWIAPAELGLPEHQAHPYDPMPVRVADYLLGKVAAKARGFTFVDIGAGKGRVLLLASRHPFGRIVGVELSGQLCRIARANVAAFARIIPQATRIEVQQQDATRYRLPDEPCVVFLYNPFGRDLMRQMADNIRQSYLANPRKIFVIYYAPELLHPFDEPIFMREKITTFPRDRTDRYGGRYGRNALLIETVDP